MPSPGQQSRHEVGPDTPVIATRNGGIFDPDDFSRYLRQVSRRAKVSFSAHVLRSTAGTLMLNAGVDIAQVAAVLGHSNPTVTARHYARVLDQGKRDALEALAGVIQPVAATLLPKPAKEGDAA